MLLELIVIIPTVYFVRLCLRARRDPVWFILQVARRRQGSV